MGGPVGSVNGRHPPHDRVSQWKKSRGDFFPLLVRPAQSLP